MKRILSLAFFAFLLAGCWYPPFDEDVSLAVSASGKLDLVYTIVSKSWPSGSDFYPVPVANLGGFVVASTSDDVEVTYAERTYLTPDSLSSGEPVPILEGFSPYETSIFGDFATSPKLVLVVPGAESGGTLSDISLISYDSGLKALDTTVIGFECVNDIAFPLYFTVFEPGIALEDLELSGLAISPSSDITQTNLHSLIHRISDDSFYELSFSLTEGGVTAFVANIAEERSGGLFTNLSGTDLQVSGKVRYFTSSQNERSYANYKSGSSYKTLSWGADGIAVEIGIGEKILAVLSSGDVLTEKNGYGRVYGAAGNLRFKFPLGDLHFVYEVYKNGEPILVFSTFAEGEYLDAQYTVYSLPTADLDTLE